MSKFNQRNFNDGEALLQSDLVTMQDYAWATMFDGVLGMEARTNPRWAEPPVDRAYGRAGYAAPVAGGSARQITNLAGTIFQRTAATSDGLTPKFLAYQCAADELLVTFAPGDATFNRLDLVCIKIDVIDNDVADNETSDFQDATTLLLSSQTFVKKRKTRIQFQVVTGTPGLFFAAPAIPAGYCVWAAVLVTPAFNAVLNPAIPFAGVPSGAVLCDMVRPMGFEDVTLLGRQAVFPGLGLPFAFAEWNYTDAIAQIGITNNTASTKAYFFPEGLPRQGAVLNAVRISGTLPGVATAKLILCYCDGTTANVVLATLSISHGANVKQRIDLTSNQLAFSGPVLQKPFWMTGLTSGMAQSADETRLALEITADAASLNTQVLTVSFECAVLR